MKMFLESSPTNFFLYKSYSFNTSDCHKISFFNDGDLKLGHFDIFDVFPHSWHLLSYSP